MGASFEIARDRVQPGAATTGELLVEGEHFCNTLELPWVDNQRGISCIPLGTYEVRLLPSKRWGRPIPHIQNVPGRSAIEIHIGNFLRDTDGCVLLGNRFLRDDVILGSRLAFEKFMEWFGSVGSEAEVNVRLALPLPRVMEST